VDKAVEVGDVRRHIAVRECDAEESIPVQQAHKPLLGSQADRIAIAAVAGKKLLRDADAPRVRGWRGVEIIGIDPGT
jgi:hypothetical protein